MIIRFRLSGGFANRMLGCDIDTDTLPASQAQQWRSLVPAQRTDLELRQSVAADLIQYEIRVEDGPRNVVWLFDELNVPPAYAPLIEHLAQQAQPIKP